MTSDDDAWDPLQDPEGVDAVRGIGDRLTQNEWRVLLGAEVGERLREVEADRLVALGLARLGKDGELQLTNLGRETLRAAPRVSGSPAAKS